MITVSVTQTLRMSQIENWRRKHFWVTKCYVAHKRQIWCHLILRYGDAPLVLTRQIIAPSNIDKLSGSSSYSPMTHGQMDMTCSLKENSAVNCIIYVGHPTVTQILMSSMKSDTRRMFIITSTQLNFRFFLPSASFERSLFCTQRSHCDILSRFNK